MMVVVVVAPFTFASTLEAKHDAIFLTDIQEHRFKHFMFLGGIQFTVNKTTFHQDHAAAVNEDDFYYLTNEKMLIPQICFSNTIMI